jgi:pSer/pThr/pTyr-binding forkhead associated (FHA) protein
MEVIGTTTIGRASDSDIILEEATVSRCHALLLRDAARVLLIDLESTNGTFVNGVQAPPDEAVRLVDGDVIALGRVTARYSASPNDRDTLLEACRRRQVHSS